MSALPATIRPIRVSPIPLPVAESCAVLEKALRKQILAEIREAFVKGWAVHYSDGTPPQYVRHAIMAAAVGPRDADDLLDTAVLASFNDFLDVGKRWQSFFRCALDHLVEDLVDRMLDGQRVTFGAIR